MKLDKKKIVFVSMFLIVLIFIVSYSMLVLIKEEEPQYLEQTLVPDLETQQEEYQSKLQAIDAIEEKRRRTIPSLYEEDLLDSMGYYDAELEEKQREMLVDSFYVTLVERKHPLKVDSLSPSVTLPVQPPFSDLKDLALEHQEFFHISKIPEGQANQELKEITVEVNGNQTLRSRDRIELRLTKPAVIAGMRLGPNTLIYGFVSLEPNRVQLRIDHINGQKIQLRAFDLQDGNEGIYLENSIRAQLGNQVAGDLVESISLPGLPSLRGIKNIFRKNNQSRKVTIFDGYRLLLKEKL